MRFPVLSASGERLTPCNPLKALRLIKSKKADLIWNEDGSLYLKLKFNPKSKVILPKDEVRVQIKETMDIFKLIPPKESYVKEIFEIAKHNRENISREDLNCIKAFLKEGSRPKILTRLASTIKRILKSFSVKARAIAQKTNVLSTEYLTRAREFGRKTGSYYRIDRTSRGLLNGVIDYLRRGGKIKSPMLKQAIESIIERIRYPKFIISKLIEKGLERAYALVNKIAKWAPQIVKWVRSEAYIIWLGMTSDYMIALPK